MRLFVLRAAFIVAVAVAAGLIRARSMPWIPDVEALKQKDDLHAQLRETAGISLERMLELIDQGAVIIDSRPPAAFEEGHLFLDSEPPVLNIPPDQIDANMGRLMELLGAPLVLYCTSDECDVAEELFAVLREIGFTDMWIYFPGYAGIEAAGLPTAAGPDAWAGFYGETGDTEASPPDETSDEAESENEPNQPSGD